MSSFHVDHSASQPASQGVSMLQSWKEAARGPLLIGHHIVNQGNSPNTEWADRSMAWLLRQLISLMFVFFLIFLLVTQMSCFWLTRSQKKSVFMANQSFCLFKVLQKLTQRTQKCDLNEYMRNLNSTDLHRPIY